ncbi:uncharacterized protein BDR25DRAFT_91460 [Lindgomyces ingoldianus]|uniref:Uncharacterized protein n=1 Tax=Lindgomyces ingoldianus TaxID=673940 RepID=A0ACB6QDY7_9PLEO|nr:uncharacterized protein BDR25DRAFT_91460 [Lindgomyces ingoldianus]KAF2465199.1 hypothetical protein BDR25DRAFT_91460 [Lindgomyces ingoldianus]
MSLRVLGKVEVCDYLAIILPRFFLGTIPDIIFRFGASVRSRGPLSYRSFPNLQDIYLIVPCVLIAYTSPLSPVSFPSMSNVVMLHHCASLGIGRQHWDPDIKSCLYALLILPFSVSILIFSVIVHAYIMLDGC